MKIITIIVGLFAIAVGVFWVYGASLPTAYTRTASRDLAMTPLQVWFRLHDHEATAQWHPDIDSVVIANDKSGLGAEYINYFHTGDTLRLRTIDYKPFSRFATATTDTTLPFFGYWVYTLEEIPTGTRLTISENSEIHGAFIRALYNLMQSDTSTVEKFLTYFN